MNMLSAVAAALALLLAACSSAPQSAPQAEFMQRLAAICGQAFEGKVVSDDAADADMRGARLVMHVRECGADAVRIPFHVGDDRSRTWVLSRTPEGLRLKHDHRHDDGAPDELTMYGGDTAGAGAPGRQEFPADQESKDLFVRAGIPQSSANTWAMEIVPGEMFAYELTRPARHFRVEFDLTRPVEPPPPPWGAD